MRELVEALITTDVQNDETGQKAIESLIEEGIKALDKRIKILESAFGKNGEIIAEIKDTYFIVKSQGTKDRYCYEVIVKIRDEFRQDKSWGFPVLYSTYEEALLTIIGISKGIDPDTIYKISDSLGLSKD